MSHAKPSKRKTKVIPVLGGRPPDYRCRSPVKRQQRPERWQRIW